MRRIFIIVAWLLVQATLLVGQDSTGRKFVKIIHSADMTIAVDSSGQTWRFDAEEGDFVPASDKYLDQAGRSSGSSRRDYDGDEVILPPEQRCTNIRVGDITELFDDVVVGLDERIEGKILCGRDVIVKGLVTGDILCSQTVTVESTGEVRGDVVAKEIRRDRGGRIHGQREEVPFPDITGLVFPRISQSSGGLASIIVMAFLIFACLIVIALVPKYLGVVIERVELEVVKSFFWGLLGWFSVLPLFVLLLITIVGIPVALLVVPLVLIIALILGFVSISIYFGDIVAKRLALPAETRHLQGTYGVIALHLPLLAASALIFMGADVLAVLFYVFYGTVMFIAVSIGFGAAITSRLGTRRPSIGRPPGAGPQASADQAPPPTPPASPSPPPKPESTPPSTPPPPVPPPPPI